MVHHFGWWLVGIFACHASSFHGSSRAAKDANDYPCSSTDGLQEGRISLSPLRGRLYHLSAFLLATPLLLFPCLTCMWSGFPPCPHSDLFICNVSASAIHFSGAILVEALHLTRMFHVNGLLMLCVSTSRHPSYQP